jgi:hypothetical protein
MPYKDFTSRLTERTDQELQDLYELYGQYSASSAENARSRYHRIFFAIFGEVERRRRGFDKQSYQKHTKYVAFDEWK